MDNNHTIILSIGEKLHIMTRRNFATDQSRHFAGVVVTIDGALARVKGYTFVFDTKSKTYQKLPDIRTRIFGLDDAQHIINVMPPHAVLESVQYKMIDDRLMIADGLKFQMDVNEFGAEG